MIDLTNIGSPDGPTIFLTLKGLPKNSIIVMGLDPSTTVIASTDPDVEIISAERSKD